MSEFPQALTRDEFIQGLWPQPVDPNNLTNWNQAVVESFGSFRDGRSDHSFGGIEEVWWGEVRGHAF